MRRLIALGCCAAYLTFGFVAQVAHVHDGQESSGHHRDSRGLHLDHTHVGAPHEHGPHSHHEHDSSDDGAALANADHLVFPTAPALQSLESLRTMPAAIHVSVTIQPPAQRAGHVGEPPGLRPGPPTRRLTPPRAPPA